MGVHGLWKLLEPSGQMVPLESLAGKVLAVDVSIWLHQAIKGVQDSHGAPIAVAHLLILFHRLCKLLFYKIKPVFVFDGGVPALKRQTMVARRQRTTAAKSEAMKVREKLIKNLLKHEAVRQVMSNETASAVLGLNSFTLPGPSVEEDLYKLPPIAADYADSESSEGLNSSEEDEERQHTEDIHSIDVTSQEFLNLPAEVRHDILTELLETRKQSSWKYLDAMPKKSDCFSDFQMDRLLKRHAVQTSLEKAGKEMGGRGMSMKELESLLGDRGVLDPKADLPSKRIAQDSVTRYMLLQRESESFSGEEEKFDIMNHLEDVDWSSESDTDVILGKSSNKRPEETKGDKRLEKEVPEIKKEPDSIPKETKVRVPDEITEILSVLEDEDVESDVKIKVESSESEITTNENLMKTDEREIEEGKKSEEMSGTESSHAQVSIEIHNLEFEEKNSEVESKDEVERPEIERTSSSDKDEGEPSIASDEKPKEISESSSDSESDFIPIAITEPGHGPNEKEKEKEGNGEALTVVIKPSEVREEEDLFADVFSQNSEKDSGKETNDMIRQYKAEFEKDLGAGDLSELKRTLEENHDALVKEKGKQERHAQNMADHIYTDAQELLRLFGIPFVIAPMEAEAQCAALNMIGLTEGTITDDSDIWLFGGRVVYKNFFNQNKHVLEYRSDNIQKYFKLTREDLIKIALLVGSDYTLGLTGVGPVTALEILAAFQPGPNQEFIESLKKFRDWYLGFSKAGPPRTTLRRKIKNVVISPGFPNVAVVEAYLHPQVDDSKEPFSWAKPNLDLIRKYAKAKLGWSTEKCNELLLPVMKKLEEKTGQATIDRHFRIVQKSGLTEGMLSKRVETAIKRLGNDPDTEEETTTATEKPKRKRKPAKPKEKLEESEEDSSKSTKKPKSESPGDVSSSSKIKLINEKLHKDTKVPQKERAQKALEDRKKEAIELYRIYKTGKKKTVKVYAKKEANLSESSSEDEKPKT